MRQDSFKTLLLNQFHNFSLKGKLHVHAAFHLKDKKYNIPFMKNLEIMNMQIPVRSVTAIMPLKKYNDSEKPWLY